MRFAVTVVAFGVAICAGCSSDSVAPTATETSIPTPSPLYTLDEARDRVQQFASTDSNVPDIVTDRPTYIACFPDARLGTYEGEDRYDALRGVWVIHCRWQVIDLRAIETATAAGQTPPVIYEVFSKTYILEEASGLVRE